MKSSKHVPLSSASQSTTTGDSQSPEGNYAFLVHSLDSVSPDTPPNVKNHQMIRQKRRRTSPEDHAILEAAYERNSKPDKTARIEIVNSVSLGEKEVQIWFQNRRQVTRRKSRPLLPHEIFSKLQSSEEDAGHLSSSSFSLNESSQQRHSSSQDTALSSESEVQSLHLTQQGKDASVDAAVDKSANCLAIAGSLGDKLPLGPSNTSEKPTDTSDSSENKPDNSQPSIPCLIPPLSQTTSTKRRPGYLANRRRASFIIHDEGKNTLSPLSLASARPLIGPEKGPSDASGSAQILKYPPSRVRLSMSLDGKAEVTTRTGNTPSPPRSQPVPTIINAAPRSNTGLQRSHSAVEPRNKAVSNASVSDVLAISYSRRSMTGRSRDARSWEFYCDSDARNALTEQAEREESGSATAAIGLIRSRSNNSKVMTPNPNKRNAHSQKPDSSKRLKADFQGAGKPKLARTISSVARLQTGNSNGQTQKATKVARKELKGPSQSATWQEDEGDSDKENWEPGTQCRNPRRRRPGHPQQAACILEENTSVPSQSSGLEAMMIPESTKFRRSATKSSSSEEKENCGPEVDDEIAAFMGEPGPREVEDLDCVQNLLSLSQAAWQ